MSHGIPDGVYELKIGNSFIGAGSKSSQGEFNTLRFDFKPASIASGNETYITTSNQSEEVQVVVPGENNKPTIFRGSKKPIKGEKECLLIFDQSTKELRMERVSANINVKKTRDNELDATVKSEIDRRHRLKKPPPPPEEEPQPAKNEKERTFSASSASLNDDDNEEEDMDVDEEANALEQMMASKPSSKEATTEKPLIPLPVQQSPPRQQQKQPAVTKTSTSPTKLHHHHKGGVQKSILHEDLQLSESSEGEED